jgi:hypothetical protein
MQAARMRDKLRVHSLKFTTEELRHNREIIITACLTHKTGALLHCNDPKLVAELKDLNRKELKALLDIERRRTRDDAQPDLENGAKLLPTYAMDHTVHDLPTEANPKSDAYDESGVIVADAAKINEIMMDKIDQNRHNAQERADAAMAELLAAEEAELLTLKQPTQTKKKKKKPPRLKSILVESDTVSNVTESHATTSQIRSGDQPIEARLDQDTIPEDDSLCVICLEKTKTHVLVPCGHRCVCEACSVMTSQQCPICRQDVIYVLAKVFD